MTASLPRGSFARKIISMYGWGREEAIREVMDVDKVTETEATRRYDLALKQSSTRSMGQWRRHRKVQDAKNSARDLALYIAHKNGCLLCPEDLKDVSGRAGWGFYIGYESTGRAYREFVLPMARSGLLAEKRDEDDKLVGYTLTDASRLELLGPPDETAEEALQEEPGMTPS